MTFSASNVLGTYCGRRAPQYIVSSTNNLLLYFHTDGYVNEKGFSLNYSFVPYTAQDEVVFGDTPVEYDPGNLDHGPLSWQDGGVCHVAVTFVLRGTNRDAINKEATNSKLPNTLSFDSPQIPDRNILETSNRLFLTQHFLILSFELNYMINQN